MQCLIRCEILLRCTQSLEGTSKSKPQTKKHICDPSELLRMCVWRISNHTTLRSFFCREGSFEPAHEIMTLFVLRTHSSNAHAQPFSGARCQMFGRTLRLLPYFMCANSEGSGNNAWMRMLAWAFAGRLCDKYYNLIIMHNADEILR